jgi:Splicing factor 1 helix-hairpin domain
VTERISTVVQDAAARELDPNKTPSPPPRYDSSGKRANTREVGHLRSSYYTACNQSLLITAWFMNFSASLRHQSAIGAI